MENTFLGRLTWRRAVNEFDPEKKVSEEDLAKILDAIHMSPSSFGIQPYHVHVVSNKEIQAKMKEKGYNQNQFVDGSHVLVFSAREDVMERIDQYADVLSGGDAAAKEKMSGMFDMMRGFAKGMGEQNFKPWAARQTYIALGFALAACAELGVDACPMEGFDPAAFDEMLGIEKPMASVVVMSLGYRIGEPRHPKVRFPKEDLFTEV